MELVVNDDFYVRVDVRSTEPLSVVIPAFTWWLAAHAGEADGTPTRAESGLLAETSWQQARAALKQIVPTRQELALTVGVPAPSPELV